MKAKLTEFGIEVRTRLMRMGQTQTWLEQEVTRRTGLYVDSSYMYRILTGQRAAPKVVCAINEILEI